MKSYEAAQPIIFLHVPKTGGTSLRSVMEGWFAPNFFWHYKAHPPLHHDLSQVENPDAPIMLYGHFNMRQGIGAPDHYPQIDQFMTVLRDPWERIISGYFYRKARSDTEDPLVQSPEVFLHRNMKENYLNHFPRPVTHDNYKAIIEEYFVATGTLEDIDLFLRTACHVFGKPYSPDMMPRLNETRRSEEVPQHLKDDFKEDHRLECEVYDYIGRLSQQEAKKLGQPRK